jgi:hypothetical protein
MPAPDTGAVTFDGNEQSLGVPTGTTRVLVRALAGNGAVCYIGPTAESDLAATGLELSAGNIVELTGDDLKNLACKGTSTQGLRWWAERSHE